MQAEFTFSHHLARTEVILQKSSTQMAMSVFLGDGHSFPKVLFSIRWINNYVWLPFKWLSCWECEMRLDKNRFDYAVPQDLSSPTQGDIILCQVERCHISEYN